MSIVWAAALVLGLRFYLFIFGHLLFLALLFLFLLTALLMLLGAQSVFGRLHLYLLSGNVGHLALCASISPQKWDQESGLGPNQGFEAKYNLYS